MRALDELGVTPAPPTILERTGARLGSEISTEPSHAPLLGCLDTQGMTILFGPGGVGKGVLASYFTVELIRMGHRVLVIDYENHPGQWASRIRGLGGSEVMDEWAHVAPASPDWTATRGPIWTQAETLREVATEFGATYAVLDSLVPACGGSEPKDAQTAGQYAAALQAIGRPSLSIGHVNRAGDYSMPFGSSFFHNLATVTWSLQQDGPTTLLRNRKHNDSDNLGSFALSTAWLDNVLGEVTLRPYHVVLADRIREALDDGPLTVSGLVEALNSDEDTVPVKPDSLRATLRRGCPSEYRKVGDLWQLA